MQALSESTSGNIRFLGVGGRRMAAMGLNSLFPQEEIGFHGIASVLANLPRLLRRRSETISSVLSSRPDVLVTIDCPAFSLGVARAVREKQPSITTVHYVLPSVWAYWPGRARKMARFVDHVLAVLPFEPAVSRKLGGPPCTYVGHSLIERLDVLRPNTNTGERQPLSPGTRPTLLVLPGSRRSEVRRLLAPFGETIERVRATVGPIDIVLPAVPHQIDTIREEVKSWSVPPSIVEGEQAKFAAFRGAQAALAASGTVTLELALSGVPMVVAYRIDPLAQWIRLVFRAHSIVLANLVLGENVVPEFVDRESAPDKLAAALTPLLRDSSERHRQLSAFERLDGLMELAETTPSRRAANVVLATFEQHQLRLDTGT